MSGKKYWGKCPLCPADDKGRVDSQNPGYALYVRVQGKGFVRIGTYHPKCGHTIITRKPEGLG
jgi:hypothetical protein